jgi:hypothetical protein
MFPGDVDLVTGDGGIQVDPSNIDNEEQISTRLFLAQIMTTLSIQRTGGSCIIKFFQGTTRATADLIRTMDAFYKTVTVTKPITSRKSNSERYVVCTGFCQQPVVYSALKKIYTVMSMSDDIFLCSLLEDGASACVLKCNETFAEEQIEEIELLKDCIHQNDFRELRTRAVADRVHVVELLQSYRQINDVVT